MWAAQGYDLTLCATVAAEVLARKKDVTSLKYFDRPIADAHRLRAGNGSDHARGSAEPATEKPKAAETKEELWRRQWGFWRRTGTWPIVWGCDPTASYGCEIPKELIDQWTAEEAEKEKA